MTLPTLTTVFPNVSKLVLDLRYLSRQGDELQVNHVEYTPSDSVDFMVPCPGGCNDGQTNLKEKISSIVQSQSDSGQGRAKCAQQLFSSSDLCGCELECQIQLNYF